MRTMKSLRHRLLISIFLAVATTGISPVGAQDDDGGGLPEGGESEVDEVDDDSFFDNQQNNEDSSDSETRFVDVPPDVYYTLPVKWSVDNNITDISGSQFGPDLPVSRGETAVWIWNMSGRPQGSGAHQFVDLDFSDPDQEEAISWMLELGITTGTSPTTFSPNDTLTRGQVAAFLWRLANKPTSRPHGFTDVTAGWQQGPVSWMLEQGITTGTSATTFSPDDTLNRAQLVTFLYRYKRS